jgi:hypothetical protein
MSPFHLHLSTYTGPVFRIEHLYVLHVYSLQYVCSKYRTVCTVCTVFLIHAVLSALALEEGVLQCNSNFNSSNLFTFTLSLQAYKLRI